MDIGRGSEPFRGRLKQQKYLSGSRAGTLRKQESSAVGFSRSRSSEILKGHINVPSVLPSLRRNSQTLCPSVTACGGLISTSLLSRGNVPGCVNILTG